MPVRTLRPALLPRASSSRGRSFTNVIRNRTAVRLALAHEQSSPDPSEAVNDSNSWYKHNRMLIIGTRGDDVRRVQRALRDFGQVVAPTGFFESDTEDAVKQVQAMMSLVPDGRVGPLTASMLLGIPFRYAPYRPPYVPQGMNLCWAASLESVLQQAWPNRRKLDMRALRSQYSQFLFVGDDLKPSALPQLAKDFRFVKVLVGRSIRAEYIVRELRSRGPLLLVYRSAPGQHMCVVYGVEASLYGVDLLIMDPQSGYVQTAIADVQGYSDVQFWGAVP